MAAYQTLTEFRLRTVMPSADVDVVEIDTPGFTTKRLEVNSSKINARLRKRYAVPFSAALVPIPEAVLDWLTKLTQWDLYLKRGVDPSDPSIAHVKADKEQADAELLEAANGEIGLFDLPVDETKDASAITKGGPMGYSETSPYVFTTLQAEAGRLDDESGSGS